MPTIREFTSALRRRPGVNAALVSGRDGLLIEGAAVDSLDLDDLAARVPDLITEATSIGDAARLGSCTTCIVELGDGYAILTTLGADSILTVLLSKGAELGPMLFELRSQRSRLESLV
ncbi:MAG: roadblock/LC7 domain-containing protein [Gemmatimonadaceae bacterium]|nr:roadblock/LC7 domain-containing protein [Gemmatimonadaceae bacterium]